MTTLTNCSFHNCASSLSGGAIYSDKQHVQLNNVEVWNCSAQWGGGVHSEVLEILQNSFFFLNRASVRGGGVRAFSIRIESSSFDLNMAPDAGAVDLLQNGNANFVNCQFLANQAEGQGAAIYVDEPTFLEVKDSVISGNRAAFGAGICAWKFISNTFFILTNVTFSVNTATQSGGGLLLNGTFSTGSNFAFKDIIFNSNEANTGGGGFFYGSGLLNFDNVTFDHNIAIGGGGGWYCQKSNDMSIITIKSQNVTFKNNRADLNCLLNDVGGFCSGNFSQCASKTPVTGNSCQHCAGWNCVIFGGVSAHCFSGEACLCSPSPPGEPVSVGAVVGGVLGGIFLIIIIVVAYVYFRKTSDYQQLSQKQ